MTNEEIFNVIKDKFAGVRMIDSKSIALLTTDGQEFTVNQSEFDRDYEIRFYCGGKPGECDSCEEHGSESWEVLKKSSL